eukprot:5532232-Amphidinium_carterae.1
MSGGSTGAEAGEASSRREARRLARERLQESWWDLRYVGEWEVLRMCSQCSTSSATCFNSRGDAMRTPAACGAATARWAAPCAKSIQVWV